MTIKIGLIGCGHIAKFHARNVRDAIGRHGIDAAYHAVCDLDRSRAESFAEIGGCALVTTQAKEVIEACDVIYVCTETAEHPALVAQAAAAGRHVFCEKPLAKNLADAERMAADVRNAGIVHQVGLVLHTSPVYRVLADLMAGDWGALLSAHMRDDQFFPVLGHYGSTWRADPDRAGSGTLLEHSIHDLDLFRRLFGEVVAVDCHTRETSAHPGIEDVAQVRFLHLGGHSTTLASVWHAVESRQSSRSLEIFFEKARFSTDSDYFGAITMEAAGRAPITLSHDEVLNRFMVLEGLSPSDEDLRSLAGLGDRRFLQCVLDGRQAVPSFEEALHAHRIVDACYRSAALGSRASV
ncbi:MAG TPA: Gfo/Idh/MocA family oxidoreductase [Pseudomonadales bacterium]